MVLQNMKIKVNYSELIFTFYLCCILGHRTQTTIEYGSLLLMILFFVYHFMKSRAKLYVNKQMGIYTYLTIVFSLFCLMSYFWCYSKPAYKAVFFSIIQGVFLCIWISFFAKNRSRVINLFKCFIIAVSYMCIKIILYTRQTGFRYGVAAGTTREAVGWHFNMACQIAAFAAIVSFFIYHAEKKKIYLVPILLDMVVIYLGGSRKSLLMPIVGIILIYILEVDKKHLLRIVKIVGFVIAIAIVSFLVMRNNEDLVRRMSDLAEGLLTGDSDDGSYNVRMFLLQKARYMFSQKPFFGWGVNSFGYYFYGSIYNLDLTGRYAHNNFWELLSCLGIVGFGLYYSKYVYIIVQAFKVRKQSVYINLCITIFAVMAIFEYGIVSYNINPLQIILVLSAALVINDKKDTVRGDIR